uniref:ATP synthase F0 subunit 8 n=1 Tax=Meranoplus bicolor TaxID=611886 RepID=A0A8K1RFY6_9HYME|nr:ATP synthase F0 subunit 8 [Meranoplus bicolor]
MPHMMPMYWTSSFLFLISFLILINSFFYFFFYYNNNSIYTNMISMNKKNWTWKW